MHAVFKSILLTALVSGLLCAIPVVVWAQDTAPVMGPPAPPALKKTEQAKNPNGIVFLELFSAESCPFCPAAERNFNDITTDTSVMGITCMVDYFDSGQTSLLSRPFCQGEQDVFVHMLKAGSNYTPQLVINGTAQLPGQDLQKISTAIKVVRDAGDLPHEIEIKLGVGEGNYDVLLPGMTEGSGHYVLRITMIKHVPDLAILNGAAQKRERSPHNIATSLIEGGIWNGKRTIWTIKPTGDGLADALIVTVQDQTSGRVLAAGTTDFAAAK